MVKENKSKQNKMSDAFVHTIPLALGPCPLQSKRVGTGVSQDGRFNLRIRAVIFNQLPGTVSEVFQRRL